MTGRGLVLPALDDPISNRTPRPLPDDPDEIAARGQEFEQQKIEEQIILADEELAEEETA